MLFAEQDQAFGARICEPRIKELEAKANQVRRELIEMIYHAGAGHIGGALSSVEVLVSLFYSTLEYNPEVYGRLDRDRFVLSKGHSCEAYYVILSDLGFFPQEELRSFMRYKSRLMGHPHPKIPGVDVATGSLGHGLSISVGMALSGKKQGFKSKVYCLLGDGELSEGSVWEAASAASHYGLSNLIAIVDNNGLQISGRVDEVMNPYPLRERWEAFGWNVQEVDGHSLQELLEVFSRVPVERAKPTVVIAHTIKGKGISFMENQVQWHHRVPTEEEFRQALQELREARK